MIIESQIILLLLVGNNIYFIDGLMVGDITEQIIFIEASYILRTT